MAKCITCGRPATGDLCEHHNDPRTQWKTISDIEECFEEKTVEIDRLRAENERLRAALEAVEWLRTGHGGARCPSCGYYFGELDHKRHSHDCPLAAALKDKP